MCWACMPEAPEALVVKVMLGHESQSVRVLIPDDSVGYRGFHDVLMTDTDAPYVAVNDLSGLRQLWPTLVVSGMTKRQLELEELCRTKI